MTTPTRHAQALARIEEQIANCDEFLVYKDEEWISQEQIDAAYKDRSAWQTLKSVLELPERPNGSYPFLPGYQRESAIYNQALQDVADLIVKGVLGE